MDTTKQTDMNRSSDGADGSSDAVRELLQFEAIELKTENVDSTVASYGCGGSCS